MTFGAALKAALGAALITGPVLGLVVYLPIAAVMMIGAGDVPFMSGAVFGGVASLVAGLAVGTPVCFLGTGAMLALAGRHPAWGGAGRWAAVGAGAGAVLAGVLYVAAAPPDTAAGVAVAAGAGALIGALGAWLCRRFVRGAIKSLDAVDTSVFA